MAISSAGTTKRARRAFGGRKASENKLDDFVGQAQCRRRNVEGAALRTSSSLLQVTLRASTQCGLERFADHKRVVADLRLYPNRADRDVLEALSSINSPSVADLICMTTLPELRK